MYLVSKTVVTGAMHKQDRIIQDRPLLQRSEKDKNLVFTIIMRKNMKQVDKRLGEIWERKKVKNIYFYYRIINLFRIMNFKLATAGWLINQIIYYTNSCGH